MVVPDPGTGGIGSETWGGRGERFAIIPMARGRCYCYATANTPAGTRHSDEAAELVRRFGAWHRPIPEILSALDARLVLCNEIEELAEPLPGYHRGWVVLVGDAAHAMTLDLGQGGCQAVELAASPAMGASRPP
jgi:2-polyprenyl-6-methoxyphenol hydroxylase-like FAD-dependent oxidoreductase